MSTRKLILEPVDYSMQWQLYNHDHGIGLFTAYTLEKMLDYLENHHNEQLKKRKVVLNSGETLQDYLQRLLQSENIEMILRFYGYMTLERFMACNGLYTKIDGKRFLLEQFAEDAAPRR